MGVSLFLTSWWFPLPRRNLRQQREGGRMSAAAENQGAWGAPLALLGQHEHLGQEKKRGGFVLWKMSMQYVSWGVTGSAVIIFFAVFSSLFSALTGKFTGQDASCPCFRVPQLLRFPS